MLSGGNKNGRLEYCRSYRPTDIEWEVTPGVIGLAASLLCFGLDRIAKR